MARPPVLALLLLVALLAPGAAAQQQNPPAPAQPIMIEGDVVWDTPQHVPAGVIIENESTLTIRGTLVHFENSSIVVRPRGALVVESTSERRSVLLGGPGWSARVAGEVRMEGTAERPVLVYGPGGIAGVNLVPTGGAANVARSFTFTSASFTARHAHFVNYTGAIHLLGADALPSRLELDNVLFSSPYGAGVIAAHTQANVTNASFEGPGGNLYLTLSDRVSRVSNLTFINVTAGLILRDIAAEVKDVEVRKAVTCGIVIGGRANVTMRDFTCEDFAMHGLLVDRRAGSAQGLGRLDLRDAKLSSIYAAKTGISIQPGMAVNFTNVSLGPVTATPFALEAYGELPDLAGVRFGGARQYAIRLMDAPRDLGVDPQPEGIPGELGWLIVQHITRVHVTQGNTEGGAFIDGAEVEVFSEPKLERIYNGTAGLDGLPVFFTRRLIDRTGLAIEPTYTLKATKSGLTGQLQGFVAGEDIAVIRLQGDAPEVREGPTPAGGTHTSTSRSVPVPGAGIVVALALAVALAARRAPWRIHNNPPQSASMGSGLEGSLPKETTAGGLGGSNMNYKAILIATALLGSGLVALPAASAACDWDQEEHVYALFGGLFVTINDGATGGANTITQDTCTDPNTSPSGNNLVGDGDPETGNNGGSFPAYQPCLDISSNTPAVPGVGLTFAHHDSSAGSAYTATQDTQWSGLGLVASAGTDGEEVAGTCVSDGVIDDSNPVDCGSGIIGSDIGTATATIAANEPLRDPLDPTVILREANCDAPADGYAWVFLAAGPVFTRNEAPILVVYLFTPIDQCIEEILAGDPIGIPNVPACIDLAWLPTAPEVNPGNLPSLSFVSLPMSGTISQTA